MPGRRAASTTARTTTGRSRSRSPRCARNWRPLGYVRAMPIMCLPTRWPARRRPSAAARAWKSGARARAGAELEALQGMQLAHGQAHAVRPGTGYLAAEGAPGLAMASTRRPSPYSRSTRWCRRPRLRPASVRSALRAEARDPRLPPRRQGSRGNRRPGRLVGVFLQRQLRPARAKRSGAWMSSYREQSRQGGRACCRSSSTTTTSPRGAGRADAAQLRGRDHAVPRVRPRPARAAVGRDLRAAVRHQVLRDFVELPSQIFEHWLEDPGVLERHAATTGPGSRSLPSGARSARRRTFNQGYETVRYAASALVDMVRHAADAQEVVTSPRSERDGRRASACPRRSA